MKIARYRAQFSAQATDLVAKPEFEALMDTARTENPFLGMGQQELAVLQLAGAAIGWQKCLEFLETAHLAPPPKPERPPTGHYQDPDKIVNPNKK